MKADIQIIKSAITRKVKQAAEPRQQHFDRIAREMGYADSNIAFKHLGKVFIEKAKQGAPAIK